MARWNRMFGARPTTSTVEVVAGRLVATFGPWTVDTAIANIDKASVTGPYKTWKVAGPPRMSLADRGITFATNTELGLCLEFVHPVAGLEPFGIIRHPTLTVTVDNPGALAAELGFDGELAHTDLAQGTLRRTLRTIVRAMVRRRSIDVEPTVEPAAPPTAELPDDGQDAESGVGPWFHRQYSLTISDAELTSTDLIDAIKRDPNIICDTALAPFVKDEGTPGEMNVGDRYTVRTAGPWDGPVQVVEVGPDHLRLATLDGHMEAGIIDIHAHDHGRDIEFEIESWARSGDRAFHVLYDVVGIAKTVQTEMWVTACELAAAHVHGTPAGLVEVSETRTPPE